MSDTSFLYPFLDPGRRDPEALLADLAASAQAKLAESRQLGERSLALNDSTLDAAAAELTSRIGDGGRVLCFGNGGSAADSLALVRRFQDLPQSVLARSLAADPSVLTALANDIGSEQIFARQIEALGGASDTAVAFSTSGQSPNLLRAFSRARSIGMLTVGFAGYGGGAMAESTAVDHLIVVGSDSVHRIQEAQTVLAAELLARIGALLADGAGP